jgi:type IV secretion system protein VirB10
MRSNTRLKEAFDPASDRDPRDGEGGEVIDLATRQALPTVTQRKKGDGLGLVAGIAFVAALGGITLWTMDAARNPQGAQAPAAQQPQQQAAAPAQPQQPQQKPAQQGQQNKPRTAVPAAPPQSAVLAKPPQSAIATGPVSNPYSSPTVVFDASAMPLPAGPVAAPGGDKASGNPNEDFAARLGLAGGGTTATATASFDPTTTVTQGTLIPAVLETAIDTDVPGYVRAVVSTDVRSFDGARVLIPRSSRLIGQYKSGVQAGQKRAYVIWTRLIRPDGVSVDIASPAVGFGGETGLEGKVKSHFFQRFGSAMLLSVIGGLSAIGGNAGVIIGGSGQSAAAAAVNQSGNISPTIRVRQGQPIRVFTAKDLDFSQVS